MLTAKAELDDRLAGFENGANDYVPKPFHVEELAARVNAQLSIGKAMDLELEFGDIVLDYKLSKLRCITNQEDTGDLNLSDMGTMGNGGLGGVPGEGFPGGGFPSGEFPGGDFPSGDFSGGDFPGGEFPDGGVPGGNFSGSEFPDNDF